MCVQVFFFQSVFCFFLNKQALLITEHKELRQLKCSPQKTFDIRSLKTAVCSCYFTQSAEIRIYCCIIPAVDKAILLIPPTGMMGKHFLHGYRSVFLTPLSHTIDVENSHLSCLSRFQFSWFYIVTVELTLLWLFSLSCITLLDEGCTDWLVLLVFELGCMGFCVCGWSLATAVLMFPLSD